MAGPHENLEHAEHAEHAAHSNKKIALLISVIALFLAFSETLGKSAQTAALSDNVEASNLWAFFQAKTIRMTVLRTAAEQIQIVSDASSDPPAKAAMGKAVDTWKKTAARYDDEPETGEGPQAAVGARASFRAQARSGAGALPSLRDRLGRVSDRHRAGVRHHHHRHDGAGLDFRRFGD